VNKHHDPLDAEAGTARNDAARLARQVEANDWKWLMSSKQGRRIAWRLLDKAGVYRTSFTGNSETFFKEGMRNMGLFIVAEIQAHSPEAYALMLTESKAST
jgi:hypothetical protein